MNRHAHMQRLADEVQRDWNGPVIVFYPAAQSKIPNQCPFPELWATFADEPRLLQGKSFDAITEAARQLAMHGRDAARRVLDPLAGMPPDRSAA